MGALTDKYCIVGVGETPHMRPSNRTTLSMACEAIKKAVDDAGMKLQDIDGMTSYNANDSAWSGAVASALGIRLNYCVDISGGGSSGEALIAHSVGLIEGGYCKAMVCFRSMNGRSGRRMGGQAPTGPAAAIAMDDGQWRVPIGWNTPAQGLAMVTMRYMKDYGMKPESLGEVAVAHRRHATLNPKAVMKKPITMEDYLSSRWVAKPLRLLDCCLETDVSVAIVIVPRERAYDLRHPPVYIMGGTARTMSPDPGWGWSRAHIDDVGGFYGRNRLFGMSGVTQKDIDFVSSYDAFTVTTLLQFEAYGFCGKGEGHEFVKNGRIQIDGQIPSNLSGGHLSEGYTHGLSMVIENVRQLRHRADDSCPRWMEGIHTYDRSKGCRQTRKADICAGLGWGSPTMSSSVILRR